MIRSLGYRKISFIKHVEILIVDEVRSFKNRWLPNFLQNTNNDVLCYDVKGKS